MPPKSSGRDERERDPGHRSEPNWLALAHGDRAGLRDRGGVIGSLYAGHLARDLEVSVLTRRAEHAPTLPTRRPAHLRQVRLHRAARTRPPIPPSCPTSTSASSRRRRPSSRRPPARSPAASPARPLMTIQNGLGAEELVRAHGDWPLLSAVTFMSGVRHADAHVEYELDTETWLGPFAGTATYEQAQEIEALLVASGLHARAFPDLRPAQWSKLIFNATVNTVAALTDLPHVGAFAARRREDRPRQPRPRPDGRGEGGCRRGGRRAARGSVGDERPRRPPGRDARRRGPYAHVPSMLEDVRAGRPTEVDFITGALVREAAKHDVPVPLHTAMYRLVKARECASGLREGGDGVRIAVIGCGAVGSLFAANLGTLDDVEVWAYDPWQAHVDAINANGLRLSGAGEVVGRVQATADPRTLPPCDLGIVASRACTPHAAMAATAHAFGRARSARSRTAPGTRSSSRST